jgi:suppressor of fused protein SUFU
MIRKVVDKHYRELWGAPSRTARFRRNDYSVDIYKWEASVNREGVTVYTTLGASCYTMVGAPTEHRVEFFVGLDPARDEIASPLAGLALYAAEHQTVVAHGHTVPVGQPLWLGTEMSAWLVLQPLSEIIPPLHTVDGTHVEFLQAIPLYPSELAFKKAHQAEGLLEKWRQAKVPFWNPDRKPEPIET